MQLQIRVPPNTLPLCTSLCVFTCGSVLCTYTLYHSQIRNEVEAPVSAVPEWENYVDDSGEVIEGTDDDDDDL